MTENLTGTVALISGASSGIGRATARRLAGAGAAVALVARRADRLDQLATEVRAAGGTALVIAADLTDADAATTAVERTVTELGRLDTLVNAAGVMLNGASDEAPLTEWDRMVDINLRGLMYVTKAALPHLLAAAKNSPRSVADVVNISSVAGRFAAPTMALYNATKFAVTGATEAWRQEYTTRNLRFSVIEPGRTETELFDQKDNSGADFTGAFGKVEGLHAEDIADAIGYIVTNPRRVAVNEIVIRPTDQQP
ncbi:SDR family NAD(P)-dependent oxidoreductase [Saccharopolyspora dendranthemae]|uniref:NADP-dependent 3-hydroxy acid dehydrogenase YdfG n=1 Tax=Saccharopolyspora dendranthemae TaxID=1181886 RepID=A0A561V7L1_9PSEU|nr:SDR family NAD(P)-dependent oxidoreductase [Saccharopolyspora dendranthemae]TWG07590.1 NADP-dependent 3-hydroxy acid dehydrogenase YdfG [Saccharopolyspora dendranthemae]